MEKFTIRKIGPSDYDPVIQALIPEFLEDELFQRVMGVPKDGFFLVDGIRHEARVLTKVRIFMKLGLSVVAIENQTGKIAGICINAIHDKDNVIQIPEIGYTCKVLENLMKILKIPEFDFHQRFAVNEIAEVYALFVRRKFRQQGLARTMLTKSLDIFRQELGNIHPNIIKCFASSEYTKKIVHDFGFKDFGTWNISEIVDPDEDCPISLNDDQTMTLTALTL